MNLVWKLLRQHVSVPQFIGFFFANLCGMLIVLLGFQFYRDVLPVFTQGDSFMGAEY
ncbi:MAG: ABC transporter permease, partial [Prevotella sp.]